MRLTSASEVGRARRANSLAFGLQGFFLAVVLTELPTAKEQFGLTDTTLVVAVAAMSILAGAGSLLAERIAVHRSSKTALRIGLGVVAVAGIGVAAAPDVTVLMIALAIYGVGLGAVDAGTNTQGVLIQHGYGTFILSSFYASWSAGAITGALFVSAAEGIGLNFTTVFLIATAVVAICGQLAGRALLSATSSGDGAADRTETTSVSTRILLIFGIVLAMAFAIDIAVGNWSALLLSEDLHATTSTAALALAAYQAASLAGRLAGDTWVRRFGARTVCRYAALIGAVGLAIVVAAPTPALAIIGFLIAGIGLPLIAPLCFSELGQRTVGKELDSVIARLNLFNYAGTLVGGAVVGAVSTAVGLRSAFLVPLLLAVLLIAAATVFAKRTRSQHDLQ
ncbi:putative major facilitator superfamily transporter [Gordonia effusa NBRC 100432]|uniref:Putative major facilitator superfamily transporter n=1 Tax=Gordonia effusa NBRC 100432 TaxID=1077974 RepID=H0R6J0_9ACTN|nr:MFS transporter [Gordonia effusa]GAB20691.1 putative major facilitator superfamily transporter [Gordonia effusa NBRC 100432]